MAAATAAAAAPASTPFRSRPATSISSSRTFAGPGLSGRSPTTARPSLATPLSPRSPSSGTSRDRWARPTPSASIRARGAQAGWVGSRTRSHSSSLPTLAPTGRAATAAAAADPRSRSRSFNLRVFESSSLSPGAVFRRPAVQAGRLSPPRHPVSLDLLPQALELELAERLGGDGPVQEKVGSGSQDHVVRLRHEGFETRGHVHRVAEHGVVHPAGAADVSHHHGTAVQGHAGLEAGKALGGPAGVPHGEPVLDLDGG